MKKLLIILFFLPAFAFSQEIIQLYPGKNKDYRKNSVTLTVYKSENCDGTGLILCPGGSYCYLGTKYEGQKPAQLFSSKGITCFILNYRTGMKGNRNPAMTEDIQTAILYIRQHAHKYGITNLGTCGFSAGGHLSGCAAEFYNNPVIKIDSSLDHKILRPDFSVCIYPVITMAENCCHKRSRRNLLGENKNNKEMQNKLSLEKNVRSDMPPIFIVQCKDDPVVDYHNALLLDSALTEADVRHKLILFDNGGHGFGISPERIKSDNKSAGLWWKEFLIWHKEQPEIEDPDRHKDNEEITK